METFWQDEFTRIEVLDTGVTNGRALLSFTGIGHALGGINVQRPEFFRAGSGYQKVLFVTDLTRSWGNSLRFDAVSDALEGCTQVDAIGNSMGAFLALLSPTVVRQPISTVIAFAPQFSADPSVVPWEQRWQDFRSAIKDWKYRDLSHMPTGTRYFVVAGDSGNDRRHFDMFPRGGHIEGIAINRCGHDVAKYLKQAGILNQLIDRCLDGTYSRDWFTKELMKRRLKRPLREVRRFVRHPTLRPWSSVRFV